MDLTPFMKNNRFHMLAFDHRGSLQKLLGTESKEEIVSFKRSVINAVYNDMSGILIDSQYGLEAYVGKDKPYLLAIEKSGYRDVAGDRLTELEYSVEQLVKKGAAGVKLLIYYDHDSATANTQMETAEHVAKECKKNNVPFFLEIVTYNKVGSKAKQIVNAVSMMLDQAIHPDVFKLEYPENPEYCRTLTHILGRIPWILLTRGATFDDFKGELASAMEHGATGFLAGRSVWQEACSMKGEERENFVKTTVASRFKELVVIAS